ncbi:hypothetical protein D7X30_12735 [Corallococcus sp. AB011P]|uniref:TonB-dependent receptor n=1 Tax=Corallococcus sp. AB011P TaxID=2316735 RepID=UPI000EA1EBE9|nr:TonB-dependent receptor [Corallococcus sp. AB011P]RKG59887.1 hypothetical protein D7X30_12735 [Corallococcus sp. AB011P]
MTRTRYASAAAFLGAALLLAPAAYAAPKKASAKTAQSAKKKKAQPAEARRVAVLASGPHADAARDALEAELARRPARYEIVPESAVRAAASRMGRDPTQPAGAAAVASELGLSAVLVADTSTVGKKHQVRVTVRNGKDGKALASPAAAKPATPKLVPVAVKRQWTALERGLQKSSAPEAAPVAPPQPPTPVEPEPAVKPAAPIAETPAPAKTPAAEPIRKPVAAAPKEKKAPETTEDSVSTEQERASAPIVEGALGVKLLGRSLRYKDDVFGVLRPYTLGPDVGGFALPGAPQVAGDVTVYPLAAFQKGALARLGITGAVDQSFGLKSTGSTGAVSYPTTAREWQAGLRYVIPFGEAQRHGFEITGTYGMNTFRIDAVDGERPLDLPNVEYKTAGLGLGVRAALSEKFDFNFRLGYQHPLDSGELSSDAWFPRMSAGAVTGSATLAYRLNRILDVRVKADLRRYFFKFNPEPGDPYVAGGAVDQYPGLSFQLGFRY